MMPTMIPMTTFPLADTPDQTTNPHNTTVTHHSTYPPTNMTPEWMMTTLTTTTMMMTIAQPFLHHLHTLGCFQNHLQQLNWSLNWITNIITSINNLCQQCGSSNASLIIATSAIHITSQYQLQPSIPSLIISLHPTIPHLLSTFP